MYVIKKSCRISEEQFQSLVCKFLQLNFSSKYFFFFFEKKSISRLAKKFICQKYISRDREHEINRRLCVLLLRCFYGNRSGGKREREKYACRRIEKRRRRGSRKTAAPRPLALNQEERACEDDVWGPQGNFFSQSVLARDAPLLFPAP